MNKVDSLGLSLILPVCPTLFLPRCLEGKTEQMLMAAAALTSLQDWLGWTGASAPLLVLSGPQHPHYPARSDEKIVFLRLSKMPGQKNGSQSVLHHDNRVAARSPGRAVSTLWNRFLALSGGH